MENEDLQEKYEKKLSELEAELIRRDARTCGLERALQSIADGNQLLSNDNLIFVSYNFKYFQFTSIYLEKRWPSTN